VQQKARRDKHQIGLIEARRGLARRSMSYRHCDVKEPQQVVYDRATTTKKCEFQKTLQFSSVSFSFAGKRAPAGPDSRTEAAMSENITFILSSIVLSTKTYVKPKSLKIAKPGSSMAAAAKERPDGKDCAVTAGFLF